MPRTKTRKRKTRKKSFKRLRPSATRMSILRVKGVSVIPDKLFCKLKYSQFFSLTSAGVNRQVFRGNSLFDPDLTGIGHQPRGFDEWSALYTRYKVHASSIKITAVCVDSNVNVLNVVPAVTSDLSVTAISWEDLTEMPYAKYRYMAPGNVGVSRTIVSHFASTKSIRGEKILDDDYSALITTNPQKEWHWHVAVSQFDNVSNPAVSIICEIIYHCEFFRRKNLAAS